MQPYPIHVGSLVRAELSRQQISVSWLAEQLGIQRPNCYRILNAQSIQTDRYAVPFMPRHATRLLPRYQPTNKLLLNKYGLRRSGP